MMRPALRRACLQPTARTLTSRRALAGRAWDGRQSTDPWRRAPAGATRATAPAPTPAARPPKTAAARAAAAATSQLNAWRSAVDWQSVQAQSAREVLNSVAEQSRQQWRAVTAFFAALALSAYFFRRDIKDTVAEEAAELGALTMSNEAIRGEVRSIGRYLAHELLHDPAVGDAAATLAADVVRRPSTRDAFLDLVVWTVGRDATRHAVRGQLGAVVGDLCDDEPTRAKFGALIAAALQTPAAQEAIAVVGADLIGRDTTQEATAALAQRLLDRDDVRDAIEDALVDAALGALGDAELRDGARKAASTTLADRKVQKSAGDALWNAYKYSIGLGPRRVATPSSDPAPPTRRRRRQEASQKPADPPAAAAPPPPAESGPPAAAPPPAAARRTKSSSWREEELVRPPSR